MLLAAPASAAPCAPQWAAPAEIGVGTAFPIDGEVTYNGQRAAVRSTVTTGAPSTPYANGITLWNLASTTTPTGPMATFSASGEGVGLGFGGYRPSDCIQSTNTRVVAIGSGISTFSGVGGPHDLTYVDILNMSTMTVTQHTLGNTLSGTAANQWAGYTNDVVITRDNAYAIVNADNYVYRVDVGSGTLLTLNIGEAPFGPSASLADPLNLCTPNGTVDSVAVTNDKAVVTTSRVASGLRTTWVYLIDITNSATLTVALEQQLVPTIPIEDHYSPHDVAITPDGTMAVVTTNHMVALFDLVSDQLLAVHEDPEATRRYQVQVDSVEVNNERAVVLADHVPTTGLPTRWLVEVFSLSRTTAPYLNVIAKYEDQSGDERDTRTHDLELVNPNKDFAFVRTSFSNVFVDMTTPGPLPLAVLPSPNGSDAHAYMNYSGATNQSVFSSDSVAVAYNAQANQLIAVTIGASETSPGSGIFQGHVDFIDLNVGPLTVVPRTITSASVNENGALPLDLALTRDRNEVAVRCADPYVDPALTAGADVNFFALTSPFTALQGYGGSGHVMGLDSIVCGVNGINPPNSRKRVVSISEDRLSPDGKVHLVDRP